MKFRHFLFIGDDKTNDIKSGSQKSMETKDNPNVDKLKRAAVSTIAAAAVKAKLLADQEEDEIRQITALLIEKQVFYISEYLY